MDENDWNGFQTPVEDDMGASDYGHVNQEQPNNGYMPYGQDILDHPQHTQTIYSDESFAPQNESYGFAVASMVLGIVALLFSCTCINIPLAVLSVIFGVVHLTKKSVHNGMAVAGFVTSGISIAFLVIAMISLLMFSNDVVSDPSGFTDDFYEEFIIEQNENDDNYDYEYDENDGYEGYINGLPMDEVGDI